MSLDKLEWRAGCTLRMQSYDLEERICSRMRRNAAPRAPIINVILVVIQHMKYEATVEAENHREEPPNLLCTMCRFQKVVHGCVNMKATH